MDNFNVLVSGQRAEVDLVHDGWTDLFRDMVTSWMPEDPTSVAPEELARLTELADFRKGDKIRARIDDVVTNQQASSEEHTSELQSLMRTSYAVFCLKQQNNR